MERDWKAEIPYAYCVMESDVISHAFSEYSDLTPQSLNGLAKHWSELEKEALEQHYEHGKTPNELYAEGMSSPEWDTWTAYRRARLLAGVCRTLCDLKKSSRSFDVEMPPSSTFLRRASRALQIAKAIPEIERTIGRVCGEVAEDEGVKPDTIRKTFNRRLVNGKYRTLEDLMPLLRFGDEIRKLKGMKIGHPHVQN